MRGGESMALPGCGTNPNVPAAQSGDTFDPLLGSYTAQRLTGRLTGKAATPVIWKLTPF